LNRQLDHNTRVLENYNEKIPEG